MTKRQLRTFFEHFNIPVNYEEQGIIELKKVVLLELKSASDDVLVIDSKTWSRNDILEFFNKPLEEGFDDLSFYAQFPWAKAISEPHKINYSKSLENLDFSAKEFEEFRVKEAVNYEKAYLDEIRKEMRDRRDSPVVGMLCYLNCFRSEFRFSVLNTVRSMMYTRLNEALAYIESSSSRSKLPHIRFMQSNAYYWLMLKIADSDGELLLTNLQVFGQGMAGSNVDLVMEIVQKQKTLPHSPEGFQFLNEIHRDLQRLQKKNNSSDGGGEWGVIRIVLSVAVAVIVALFRCSQHRNSSSNYSNPTPFNIQELEQEKSTAPRSEFKGDSVFIYTQYDTIKLHRDKWLKGEIPDRDTSSVPEPDVSTATPSLSY